MRIDHVILVTLDADSELTRLRELGFGSETDGVFADGVRNWIVPMESGQYLEVVAPARRDDAGPEWLRRHVEAGRWLAGWGVEVPSVDDVGERLGLRVELGALLEDDQEPPWHNVDCPPDQSFLPFFITYKWTNDLDEDGRLAAWRIARLKRVAHDVAPLEISQLDLVGDRDELDAWLGGELPTSVAPGAPARLTAVRIRTAVGEVVLTEH